MNAQEAYIQQLEQRCHMLEAKVGRLQEGCRNLLESIPLLGGPPPNRVDDTTAERGVANQRQGGNG